MDRKLYKSEKIYHTLFESAKDAIFISDEKGKFIDVNKAACESLGYNKKELLKMTIKEIDADSRGWKAFKKIRDGLENDIIFDVNQHRKDGTILPVEVTGKSFYIGDKKYFQAIARDIGEWKSIEKELKDSEEKYRTVFEATGNGTIIIEKDTTVSLVNKQFEKLSGYRKEEIEGKRSWTEFVVKEDLGKMKEFHKKRRIVSDKAPRNYEFRCVDKHGNIKDIYLTIDIIPGTKKSIASLLDITEQNKMEKALRESEKKYRQLAETAKDVILLLDLKGNIKYVNQEGLRLSGYNNNEALKMNINDVLPANLLADSYERFNKRSAGDAEVSNYEIEFINKKGNKTPVEIKSSLITTNDNPSGVLIIARDTTNRLQTERALQVSEKKYRSVLEQSVENIYLADFKTKRIIEANKSLQNMLGYSEKEIKRLTAYDFVAHSRDDIESQAELLLKRKQTFIGERKYRKKDRTLVNVDVTASIITLGDKKVLCVVSRDITKRKQIEDELAKYRKHLEDLVKERTAKLQESEKKYRTLFESSQDAIMILAPPTWHFTTGNTATIKMFKGKNEKEFISKSPWELSPEYQPDGQLSSEKAIKMIETAMKTGSHFFEWTHKRLDGNDFSATVLLTRIELEGKNLLQATARDITKRKQAEEELKKYRKQLEELVEDRTAELKKREVKYRTLTENLNIGIYRDTVGKKGNFIEINPALIKIFGYKNRKEVFKLNVSDLYQNSEDRNIFNQKMLKTGFVKNEELNLKKKDGLPLICSVSAVAIKDENGKVKYYDGIIDDITERKQAEEELHKYADTQKILLQEVNHRVKNNLTAILGLLNMEESKTINKDNLIFIKELRGQINGLSTVHNLLSQSGWGPLNLNLLCIQIIKASLSCLPNSNLVVFNVSPTKISVNSNQANHLAIVINELITNSLKYGQNKKNEVRIIVDFTINKENITITYKDNGKGYPQELIDGDFNNVGVGYDLINGIVTQSLMGELQIYNDNGAVISISFNV